MKAKHDEEYTLTMSADEFRKLACMLEQALPHYSERAKGGSAVAPMYVELANFIIEMKDERWK